MEKEIVKIEADSNSYKVGDLAKLKIFSPFYPCDGLATIRSNGIIRTISFHMSESISSKFLLFLY